jgi:uncharacterized delta-60 repeat protein
MRVYEMVRRRRARLVGVVTLAVIGALAAFASTAGAAPSGSPLRIWSVSEILQGPGRVEVSSGAQTDGALDQTIDTGTVAFNLRGTPLFDRASGHVFSSATGHTYGVDATAPSRDFFRPQSARGTATHLDEYQAYVKTADRASLKITLSQAELVTVDSNSSILHCTPGLACRPIRTIVRFHARAYASSTNGDFYDVGGAAYLEGRRGHWGFEVATTSDSQTPGWTKAGFGDDPDFDSDVHGLPTGEGADLYLPDPVTIKVPLKSVRRGELFAVHVSLDAQAVDDLGFESAAQAFIRDPQDAGPGLLTTHGLTPKGAPKFAEPRSRPLAQARCPRGRPRGAGTLQLSSAAFAASEGDGDPLVLVTRSGGSRGAASVTLTTHAGTATAGADYRTTKTIVRFGAGDTAPRLVDIPLREDAAIEPDETFTVALGHARCAGLSRKTATITIADDDAPPPPAPQPPPAPTPAPTPTPAPAPPPAGLDPTFGDGGRVSEPVGDGQASALVIEPAGDIVTAGVRGPFTARDFAVARHDTFGRLDPGFGVVGTDLGGHDDQANDAVSTPDGVVAVGSTDVAGAVNSDFALVRYGSGSTPDPRFDGDGIVTTDIAGRGDQANAVVLEDGKILVAGSAFTSPIDKDFALARYNTDGTLDHSFGGGDGIVTTNLGTQSDQANAVAIAPDGTIVVAGAAGEDVALARYMPSGDLIGTTVTDLGFDDVAEGVAITADGHILLAGSTLGAKLDHDFLLLRYDAHGVVDSTFGDHGVVKTDFGHGDDLAHALVLDAQGRIVVAGRAASGTVFDFGLARYHPDGTLDTSFGSGGLMSVDFNGLGDEAEDVALDSAGRIVAAGYTLAPGGNEFALLRALP